VIVIRWLWSNLSSMVLAVVLAVLVWVAAQNEENPIEERVYSQALAVQVVGEPENMILTGPTPSTATLTLRAPRVTWSTLTADQIRVAADLTGLAPGSYDVPVAVTVNNSLVQIVRVNPVQVRVTLEESSARSVRIHLTTTGEVAVGYQAGEPKLSVTEAEVKGPASLVDQVSELHAEMRIAGARGGLQAELSLVPVDAQGATVNGVTLEPSTVQVSVPVEQLGGYRDVAVKVVVTGQVAPGYRVTNISVTPLVVTLYGANPSAVANLPGFVETEPLSIEGASDDVQGRVALKLDEGVSLVGEQAVFVQVSIAAIESSLTVTRDLEVTGLGPGLAAEASPPSVDVILSGPLLTLDALKPEDVRVVLNLVGLARGKHQVQPDVVVLPDQLTVQTVLPAMIEVEIKSGPPATPSPIHSPTPSVTPTATRAPVFLPTWTPIESATPPEATAPTESETPAASETPVETETAAP
jgi:YbbR domain-containing protein